MFVRSSQDVCEMFRRSWWEVQSELTIGLNKLCKKLLRNLKEVWKKFEKSSQHSTKSLYEVWKECSTAIKKIKFMWSLFKIQKNVV